MKSDQYSSYDSEQQDDQVDEGYLNRIRSQKLTKLQSQMTKNVKEEPQEDDGLLKPKLKPKNQSIISNQSSLTNKGSKIPQRPLTAAYTFKLPNSQIKRKKNDPVSLFQATSQLWRKDKFLVNRANNKEGRKLELDKRNRNIQMMHGLIQ